ncbi:alpha/beta fold hydrolase [Sphaerospermopsis aphanizomenoides BCCUSP55]|uniref:alpha/beta fold hydrolase n=1 Tax=Sphaerospermopsis aphanizomenoides TaxID=459663 RepID=UPI000A4BEBCF|nr:alpha/beta fold hydrolase [Sphaerospermopsis aphanizomenoides]MBK1986994.1 alpha/beta fold hydrolase [Sphaerospermopsis aphanizomenoides BCCUSP55]
MNTAVHWQQRVGNQRDWIWRGWQIRYTYIRSQYASVQCQNQQNTTPLILLHGFGASIGHWRHNLEVLSEYNTVYALDMLGFGASEKASVNYSVELWVEQVYEFWQAFIRQPVILVGNSTGSLITLVAAAVHPEMVKGIVMMSLPDPTLEQEAIPTFLHPVVSGIKSVVASPLFLKPLFKFLRRPGVLRRWASLAYASREAITDELIEILAGPPQDRGSTRAFIALFKASIGVDFSPSVKKILPNLTIPILLIWGQKDRFVPPVLASEFARYNEKLELLYLEDVGHCPHDESPEQVNKVILNWIQRNS